MTIRVAVEHRTTYRFDRPITLSPHVVRLRPAPHTRTPVSAYSLTVTPANHFVNWQQDAFGNHLARLVFPERATELSITVDLVADMTVINPFDFFVEEYAETYPFSYPPELRGDLEPYLRPIEEDGGSGTGPLVREWMSSLDLPTAGDGRAGMPIVDFLVAVNQRVARDVAYSLRMEPGVQSPDETLRKALGSCRDSAWLLVSVLRELGLAARFVSGYLVQLQPDSTPLQGPTGPASDFTDLHAWAEVYIPGAGWIGFDATSGLAAGEGHIPLAATPHPSTAAPVSGILEAAEVEFDFANIVTRVREDARVTAPYTREAWARIDALGHHVDTLLQAGDVRLTMGGEPTFVAVDDMEAPEWNTDADGPDKRRLAADLAGRLRERWARGGVVHHGQGKWYPGEPLPRWQIALTWRDDGRPLWKDAALLDEPWSPPLLEPGSPKALSAAEAVARGITARVGAPDDCLLPAFEDRMYDLWQGAREPLGDRLDPGADADPDSTAPVADQAAALDPQPQQPAGWVLPLHRAEDGTRWATSRWHFRRGRLVLGVGTSPLGLRLPLDAVAWTPPPLVPDRSPFENRDRLPPAPGPRHSSIAYPPAEIVDPAEGIRTALSVQERDGHLFVFLPPLTHIEHAVELLGAVEESAKAAGVPVVLEGYPLPGDERTTSLTVTPDPGVVEVNVQPAASWVELVEINESLHVASRASRLGTEKFALDGLHTGTGGGSHLTLGGRRSSESPLLRRPDLLRSMITFWQHHPSLSYLFSGRFIGPTSQAPRVDEGRHETLYEMELAFAELDRAATSPDPDEPAAATPPWMVDRALRHLLTDITGNTHRSEFCIDKLFSPDSERGRLGLLELRGFEMPPHREMSLVQALLVRSLVSRFWSAPYRGSLVRWGTELHDRFLLPSPVAADIADVVDDLREHGIAFEHGWLEPFLEFRFPLLGEADIAGVHLELRQAIEPWNVLGEEVTGSGTARYVDSSLERVQIQARGVVAGRHLVTCNGVPVPLTPTRTAGEVYAGVRFTAWAPPSKLHPTIGVQAPLVFDVVDRWSGRSLGGFTYHVVHPGGRAFERYPVNAAEAESRRSARFVTDGHTPGPIDLGAIGSADPFGDLAQGDRPGTGAYPSTLDLRRFASAHRRPSA